MQHSLSDAVWDLHVLGGDEAGEVLEALHQLELPAELRAEEDEGMERGGGGGGVREKQDVCGCGEEEQT